MQRNLLELRSQSSPSTAAHRATYRFVPHRKAARPLRRNMKRAVGRLCSTQRSAKEQLDTHKNFPTYQTGLT